MMFSDVPNLIATFGYTTASWTLGADLISEYACKLINLLDKKGLDYFCPEIVQDLTFCYFDFFFPSDFFFSRLLSISRC